MWLMVQQDVAQNYVVATNQTNTVRECIQVAFDEAGTLESERYVEPHPQFVRPAEVDQLIGSYAKAERNRGWRPKTTFGS